MLTRFAPTTSGYLHLGHALNALYVWGIAGANGGKVLLRIEDHDRQRCKPEYEAATLEDIAWLGFQPDLGTQADYASNPSPFRQSNNPQRYQTALESLAEQGLVYACDCTRRQLAERIPTTPNAEVCYDGHCRTRGLGWGGGVSLRIRIPDEPVSFTDLALGHQTQHPARQCGDIMARDRDGNWTYQFCVVVDDAAQHITHVIRGIDLLESTGRQILLARLLGHTTPPKYLHHTLLVDETGQKLSKRFFSESLAEMRQNGAKAEEILGRAAWLGGLLPAYRTLFAKDAPSLFSNKPV